jgi:hypothetical protein
MMAVFIFPLWFFALPLTVLEKDFDWRETCFLMKQQTKEKIFGFHRSMDTLGPSLALLYLYFYPELYYLVLHCVHSRTFAIAATLLLKKKKNGSKKKATISRFGLLESKSSHVPQSRYRSFSFHFI